MAAWVGMEVGMWFLRDMGLVRLGFSGEMGLVKVWDEGDGRQRFW